METKAKLEQALKDAMRAQEDLRKTTIRMALSAIKQAEIDRLLPQGAALEETAVLAILQKEVKMRRESLEEAQQAGRQDLVQTVLVEISILEEFLPQAMDAEALEGLAKAVIAELGATSLREMGQVMKTLLPRLQGRATGDQASQIVRRLLQ